MGFRGVAHGTTTGHGTAAIYRGFVQIITRLSRVTTWRNDSNNTGSPDPALTQGRAGWRDAPHSPSGSALPPAARTTSESVAMRPPPLRTAVPRGTNAALP